MSLICVALLGFLCLRRVRLNAEPYGGQKYLQKGVQRALEIDQAEFKAHPLSSWSVYGPIPNVLGYKPHVCANGTDWVIYTDGRL